MMTQHAAPPSDFDDLAADYERYRVGYSSDLFDALEKLGLQRGFHVLDAGCGTGLAMQPLAARGMTLTGLDPSARMLAAAERAVPQASLVQGVVETLPFSAGVFDAAVSAQAFHWFDADRAFAELIRVVKPGGPIAVWWKVLGSDDPLRALRSAAAAELGLAPSPDALRSGFNAFYRAPLATRSLRVVPFVARLSVEDALGYERSRASLRAAYGARRDAYLALLRAGLVARYGAPSARFALRYTQYLYVGTAG